MPKMAANIAEFRQRLIERKINMEDLQNSAANELEVADQQIEVTTEVPEVTAEPTQQTDVTQTQSFAHRLKEERAKVEQQTKEKYEAFAKKLGYSSFEEMEEAQKRQDLMNEGKDPDLYMRLERIEQENQMYKQEKMMTLREKTLLEQETSLKADPIKGSVYQQFEQDIKSIVNNSKEVDYESAFAYVVAKNLDKVLAGTATKAEQTAVQKIINNQTTSPGSLSQGADNTQSSIRDMADKDFEALLQRVKRGEVKSL